MNRIVPLKRFGQNYLTDKNIVRKIAEEISPDKDDFLLEIGPGKGALTEYLSKRCNNVTAFEIDKRVIEDLRSRFPAVKFIQGDFLKSNLQSLAEQKKKMRIAGNIPYNLTSPIIFKLIENRDMVEDAVLTVQYEVAKRITAHCGSKDYSILSVITQFFTDAKLCFKISPNVFYPKPKVYSAVIHLYFKTAGTSKEFQDLFIKIVKASFGNRRKTIKNSLSNSIFTDIDFSDSGIDLSLRAENLEIKDFITLTKFVWNKDRNYPKLHP